MATEAELKVLITASDRASREVAKAGAALQKLGIDQKRAAEIAAQAQARGADTRAFTGAERALKRLGVTGQEARQMLASAGVATTESASRATAAKTGWLTLHRAAQQATATVGTAGVAVAQTGRQMQAAGRSASSMAASASQASRQVRQVGESAKQTTRSVETMSRGLYGANQTTLGMITAMYGMQIIGGLFNLAGAATVAFNGQLEQSQVAWENMLQSADGARYVLNLLKEFSAVTPFEFPELEQDVRLLASFGFAVNDILQKGPKGFQGLAVDIGNAAAYGGRGAEAIKGITVALGSMKMAGKVNAQDMMQMINAGVPAWDILAKYIGKSTAEVRKMSDAGEISGETMVKAFQAWARSPQVGKMMEAQSRTFLGVISTIKDNLRIGLSDAFLPVFNRIADLARAFADVTQTAAFTSTMSQIAGVLSGLLVILDSIPAPLRNAAAIFGVVAVAVAGASAVFGVLAMALGAVLGPVLVVAGAAAALYLAWETNFLGLRDIVASVMPAILDAVATGLGAVVGFFEERLPAIQQIVANVLNGIQDFWERHGVQVTEMVATLLDYLGKLFNEAMNVIVGVVDFFLDLLQGNWAGALGHLGDVAVAVWRGIVDVFASGGKLALQAMDALFGGIEKLANMPVVGVPMLDALTTAARFVKDQGGLKGSIAEIDRVAGAVKGLGFAWTYTGGEEAKYQEVHGNLEGPLARGRRLMDGWTASLARLSPAAKTAWQQFRDAERQFNNASAALDRNKAAADAAAAGMGDAGKAAKEAGLSTADFVKALVETHPATIRAAQAVGFWEGQIASVNLAIKANQDQLKAAQKELQGMQDHLADLQTELSAAQMRLEEFSRPRLSGMGQMEMQIGAVEAQLKRLQLAKSLGVPLSQIISQYPQLTAGAEDYLGTLPTTQEALEKILEQLQLTQSLSFDEKMRLLQQAAEGTRKEMDYSTAMQGVVTTKARIDELTGAIATQEAAIKAQELVVRSIQEAGERLNETLQTYQDRLKGAQDEQKAVVDGLTQAYTWLIEDRQKMIEMGGEAAVQAGVVDARTRELFAAFDKYAKDTTGSMTGSITGAVSTYQGAVASILAELAKIPREITTVHKVITETQTFSSAPGGSSSGVLTLDSGGIVTGPTLAALAMNGRPEAVVPLSGGLGLDYDKLAAILAAQPVIVQIDGQTIARVTRAELLKTQSRNANLWG